MKRFLLVLALFCGVVVFVLSGLGPAGFDLGRIGLGDFSLPLGGSETKLLEGLAYDFLEDLQYKDFDRAATYHTFADQGNADIPNLIERLFLMKPEQLNIRDIRIVSVDLDRGGSRARTFFKTTVEQLNSTGKSREETNREREVEGILYWHRRPAEEGYAKGQAPVEEIGTERWFMMLESSLRR